MGSGRTQQQAQGGFGRSDDTYDSGSGMTGKGDSYVDNAQSGGRTGGGFGADDTQGDAYRVSQNKRPMYSFILTLRRVVGLAQAKTTNTAWVPTALGEFSFPLPARI